MTQLVTFLILAASLAYLPPTRAQVEPSFERPLFLVTSFEPYQKRKSNRSDLVREKMRELYDRKNSLYDLETCLLPVTSELPRVRPAGDAVIQCIEGQKKTPIVVLSLGESPTGWDSFWFLFETVGRNEWRPDGSCVVDDPLEKNGEKRLAARFPYHEFFFVADDKTRSKLDLSSNAGLFACNQVLYTTLRYFSSAETRVGFVHVDTGADEKTIHKMAALLLRGLQRIAVTRAEEYISQFPHFTNEISFPLSRAEREAYGKKVDESQFSRSDRDFYRKLRGLSL